LKTQYYTASSLDGFTATPDNSLEWLFQFGDVGETSYPLFIKEVGAIAMGSNTYEWILKNQVQTGPNYPQAWPYPQPSWVFTSRPLKAVPGGDLRFVRGDVRAVHRDMSEAAGGKNIWVMGGGELAGQFYDHGLLDEVIVQVTSVTLGRGAPLLPRTITNPPLRLVSVKAFRRAFVELHYVVPRG
jgi:dihydrofolate reductase